MNIKKTFRIIFRNKTYGILNLLGLAVGITSAALIFLWVEHMVSFNKAIPNAQNIYSVWQHQFYGDETYTFRVAPGPLAETIEREFPSINRIARIDDWTYTFIPENTRNTFRENGWYADSTLFSIASVEFVRGDAATVFKGGYPIVISEEMAHKMFGDTDPIGKRVGVEKRFYEITGVFKNMPENTNFQFEWLIPFSILVQDYIDKGWTVDGWGQNWHSCFVEVAPEVNVDEINAKLKVLISEKSPGKNTELFIYPILKHRLYAQFKDGKDTGTGYIKTVRLFSAIGIIILLIACINFMNLSTARSQSRALEVGVRKTFGTKRKSLIAQFLYESGLITLLAILISIGLVYLCLPIFNQLVSVNLSIDWTNPLIIGGILFIWLFCTLLAGSYPAFFLSSFSPVSTLKKQHTGGKSGSVVWIRKALVVFQFAVAFALICATLAVFKQIQYGQGRDIGLNKENLAIYQIPPEIRKNYQAIQNELKNTGIVESAGLSQQLVIRIGSNGGGYKWKGKDMETDPLIYVVDASSGLIDAAGMTLLEGQDFQPHQKGGNYVIINEALAEIMKEEGRVGGRIGQGEVNQYAEVIGIVKNVIFNDIYTDKVEPMIIFFSPESSGNLFVRLKPGYNTSESLKTIQTVLHNFLPDESFSPVYMNEYFDNLFKSEKLEGKLAGLFAALAIFISCLGLFGLSAFSAEQRTREIGIRKVLGASTFSIICLLVKSYLKLILIAFTLGIPTAVYITNKYLSDYSYRISLDWTFFGMVALLVVGIALCTVSFQSLKAAIVNPVKSIKTE